VIAGHLISGHYFKDVAQAPPSHSTVPGGQVSIDSQSVAFSTHERSGHLTGFVSGHDSKG